LVRIIIAIPVLDTVPILFHIVITVPILNPVAVTIYITPAVPVTLHPGFPAASLSSQNGRSILLTTWTLIFMAEFGDKTQLAVAGLAGTHSALPVWLGATAGLALTTSLGVLAGRTLLRRLPMTLLQRLSGAFFLMLAAVAGWHFLRNF
jgi:putative Ca2+/H+ antiporter (TMEM165/GDT1 family)